MSGFFDLSAVASYSFDRDQAFSKLGCPPGVHRSLCDLRACEISTQGVLAAFAIVIGDPRTRAKRIAFLTESVLMRRQIGRMADVERARCFGDEADALAWLNDPISVS